MTGTEELRGVSLAGEGRGSRLRTLGKGASLRAAGGQAGLGCEEGGPSGLGGPLLPEGVDLSWEAPGDRPGPAAMREEPFPQQDQVSGTQARPPNQFPPSPRQCSLFHSILATSIFTHFLENSGEAWKSGPLPDLLEFQTVLKILLSGPLRRRRNV